jgi:hypothetical protein
MEWLNFAHPIIERMLHWKVPSKQVLPHEVQAVRANKKSLRAKDTIPKADYDFIVQENIYDLLLYHIIARIFMERLYCE